MKVGRGKKRFGQVGQNLTVIGELEDESGRGKKR